MQDSSDSKAQKQDQTQTSAEPQRDRSHSLTYAELAGYAQWLDERLHMAQLQDVITDGQLLVFTLYLQGTLYLVLDLQLAHPSIVLLSQKPPIAKQTKPLILFLKAHAEDGRLRGVQIDKARGRVLQLSIVRNSVECEIQCELVPRHTNVQVHIFDPEQAGPKQRKTMAWIKPKDLPPATGTDAATPAASCDEDWAAQYAEEWWALRWGSRVIQGGAKVQASAQTVADFESHKQKLIAKKQKAIAQVQAQLQDDKSAPLRELGELLKWTTEIPEHLRSYYDSKKSAAENREISFRKAKDIERKRAGTEARLAQLQQELTALHHSTESATQAINKPQNKTQKSDKKSGSSWKGRTRHLGENMYAVIGKSAVDNLAILRESRSWDLWLHLRDYPGAHAILFREKGASVSDAQLAQVANWLLAESVGQKQIPVGSRYDVLVAECRFVRPIKGAVGKVNYTNERTFTFASKPKNDVG